MELLLFDHEDDAKPGRMIRLNPVADRTYYYWNTFVPGVGPGQLFGYRVTGLDSPDQGQ